MRYVIIVLLLTLLLLPFILMIDFTPILAFWESISFLPDIFADLVLIIGRIYGAVANRPVLFFVLGIFILFWVLDEFVLAIFRGRVDWYSKKSNKTKNKNSDD